MYFACHCSKYSRERGIMSIEILCAFDKMSFTQILNTPFRKIVTNVYDSNYEFIIFSGKPL